MADQVLPNINKLCAINGHEDVQLMLYQLDLFRDVKFELNSFCAICMI